MSLGIFVFKGGLCGCLGVEGFNFIVFINFSESVENVGEIFSGDVFDLKISIVNFLFRVVSFYNIVCIVFFWVVFIIKDSNDILIIKNLSIIGVVEIDFKCFVIFINCIVINDKINSFCGFFRGNGKSFRFGNIVLICGSRNIFGGVIYGDSLVVNCIEGNGKLGRGSFFIFFSNIDIINGKFGGSDIIINNSFNFLKVF